MILKLQQFNQDHKQDELIETSQVKVDLKEVKTKEEALEYEKTVGAHSCFKTINQVRQWPADCYVLNVQKKGQLDKWETIVTYNSGIFLCNEETGKTVDILSKRR